MGEMRSPKVRRSREGEGGGASFTLLRGVASSCICGVSSPSWRSCVQSSSQSSVLRRRVRVVEDDDDETFGWETWRERRRGEVPGGRRVKEGTPCSVQGCFMGGGGTGVLQGWLVLVLELVLWWMTQKCDEAANRVQNWSLAGLIIINQIKRLSSYLGLGYTHIYICHYVQLALSFHRCRLPQSSPPPTPLSLTFTSVAPSRRWPLQTWLPINTSPHTVSHPPPVFALRPAQPPPIDLADLPPPRRRRPR